jgi:hypothetical protein
MPFLSNGFKTSQVFKIRCENPLAIRLSLSATRRSGEVAALVMSLRSDYQPRITSHQSLPVRHSLCDVGSRPRTRPSGTGRLWSCAQFGSDKGRLAVAFIRSRFTESSRTSPVCLLLFEFFCLMPFLPHFGRTDFEMSIDLALA